MAPVDILTHSPSHLAWWVGGCVREKLSEEKAGHTPNQNQSKTESRKQDRGKTERKLKWHAAEGTQANKAKQGRQQKKQSQRLGTGQQQEPGRAKERQENSRRQGSQKQQQTREPITQRNKSDVRERHRPKNRLAPPCPLEALARWKVDGLPLSCLQVDGLPRCRVWRQAPPRCQRHDLPRPLGGSTCTGLVATSSFTTTWMYNSTVVQQHNLDVQQHIIRMSALPCAHHGTGTGSTGGRTQRQHRHHGQHRQPRQDREHRHEHHQTHPQHPPPTEGHQSAQELSQNRHSYIVTSFFVAFTDSNPVHIKQIIPFHTPQLAS